MNQYILGWIALLLLIDLVATATRFSLLNIRHANLISLQQKSGRKVKKTIDLVTRRARTRAALKFFQILLRLSMVVLVLCVAYESRANQLLVNEALLITIIIALLLWLIEFVIERQVLNDTEAWAIRLTPFADILLKVLSPILALPLKLSGSDTPASNLVTISEDELISLVDASQRAGEIEKDEREMIHSVFRMGETMAREIMVPRVETTALDVKIPLDQAANVVLESGFSRIPVFEGQSDNIIGLLYTKDMLKVWQSGEEITSLKELLRPAYFIPETKKVDELLDEMRSRRIHIAVVVDEYGGVAGVVTLEDIIEEIFGEIEDEYDDEEALFTEVSPEEYIFNGRVMLDDINELMGIDLEAENADTLGGLIYSCVGRVPRVGEELRQPGVIIKVEQVKERRIGKVRVRKLSSTEE